MSKIENLKSKLRIAVIGPGGIGCLFAGLLSEGGHDVCLVDRRPDRAAVISREGILIERDGTGRRVRLPAFAHPSDISDTDLIILCVKAHETAGTIPSILALSGPQTEVLSLQNGLGNMEAIKRVVAGRNLFAGVTTHGATVIGLNYLRHAGAGLTVVGSINDDQAGAERLAGILTSAGIETQSTADTLSMLWSKLVINAAICPVSVMSGLPNGQMAENDKWRSLLCAAAEEGGKIAGAKGIKLMFADPVKAVLEVCDKTASNISSMLQDVRRGRQTEITAINGAIVRAAAELGLDTPTNTMLYENVVELEKRNEYKCK
ncbi:MAG: 2-dehydropantoate 2-reductase [Kiritimatiellia bacterium]|nr:2-dehydropantoate 2-reductase [Kiritimatiellia bacterium]